MLGRMRNTWSSYTVGGVVHWQAHFWKVLSSQVEQMHIQWPNIGLSEIHSYVLQRQVQDYAREICTRMVSFICNKWKLEKTQVSICTKIDKWYIHRTILCISKYTAREIMETELYDITWINHRNIMRSKEVRHTKKGKITFIYISKASETRV